MEKQKIESNDSKGFFDTLEMKEIMDFLEAENSKKLDAEKLDKIAKAWSKVDRKKLYKN